MSLINCKTKRNSCGVPLPSTCVGYDGMFVGVLKEDDFECNVNLDDVVEKISTILAEVKEKSEKNTLDITKLQTDLTAVKKQLSEFDIAKSKISLDLGCLAAGAAPCETSPKTYTLLSILQLFKNEICSLKS